MYAVHACASSVRNLHALSVPCRTYHMHTNFCRTYTSWMPLTWQFLHFYFHKALVSWKILWIFVQRYQHIEWLRHHCMRWFVILVLHCWSFTDVFVPSIKAVAFVGLYKDVWAVSVGAVLQCEREARNSKDPYAVAVQKDGLSGTHSAHHILHHLSSSISTIVLCNTHSSTHKQCFSLS